MLFFSCSFGSRNEEDILKRAEILLEQDPDSALWLLETEIHPKDLNKEAFSRHALLSIKAKDILKKDFKNDTLIFNSRDFYIEKKDWNNAALTSYYCGRVLSVNNNKEKAMDAYLAAKRYIKIKDNNYLTEGLIEFDIGELYFDQLLKDEAIERFKNAEIFFDKTEKYKNVIVSNERIGTVFLVKGEIDSCLYYYNKALTLAKTYRDSIQQGFIIRNIGLIYNRLGDPSSAQQYFHDSYKYFSDDENKANTLLNLAYSFNDAGNKDSTLHYVNKSLDIIKDSNHSIKLAAYRLLARIAERDKQHDQALTYHKEYSKHLMKTLEETNNQAILDVQKKYDFELVQNENNRLVIEKQSAAVFLLGLLLATLIIIFYYYNKNVKNKAAVKDAQLKAAQLREMANSYVKEMADSFGKKEDSMKKVLLQHFNITNKVASVETQLLEGDKSGTRLLSKINDIIYKDGQFDWDLALSTMDQLFNGFPERLRKAFPQLDDSEYKICCLSYAKLNNNEIAIIMNLSQNTIQMKRSSIRRKLGIGGYSNIVDFISKHV